MGHKVERRLQKVLARSLEGNLLRNLSTKREGIDFCSNDYLGLARSGTLRDHIRKQLDAWGDIPHGATGSRLISGNYALAESLEQELADFHGARAGLLFGSGFAANTGLWSSVAVAGDCLLMDELIHASSIDGARLSKADRLTFRHNDTADLCRKLDQVRNRARGNIFIGIESLYSMDGDRAPLETIAEIAASAGAGLIVDEAHSNGISGRHGRGMVSEAGLEDEVFARVHTFGKGIGLHGAVVLGSETLKSYLVNFARPFIFSTGPSHDHLLKIRAAYRLLPELDATREHLFSRVQHFRRVVKTSSQQWLDSDTWVQSVMIPGEPEVLAVAEFLEERGFWVKAIRAPSIAAGSERIRICLHAFNTREEIEGLVAALDQFSTENLSLAGSSRCADASSRA
jgi:8-amino-7-oxononanoate synthase